MSHWYTETGETAHTSVGAKGQEVKTTLAHARKRGLYPSVTTVLDILDKPSLVTWKNRQITDTAFKEQSIDGETAEDYNKRILQLSFDQVDTAKKTGSAVHDAIETYYSGKNPDFDYNQTVELPNTTAKLGDYVQLVSDWVMMNEVKIGECELRLVNKKYGYAGTTDITFTKGTSRGIGDFKTRRTKEGQKITPYDTEPAQIAAYHMAKYGSISDDASGFNLYLSTTELGRCEAVWYDAKTLREEWHKFYLTLQLWQAIKKYSPTQIS